MTRTAVPRGLLATLALAALSQVACSETVQSPLWEDAGEAREAVLTLEIGNSPSGTDTLAILGRGVTAAATHPTACRWEHQRSARQVDLTLWVRAERWAAASVPPPYSTGFSCATVVEPPLPAGYFLIVVRQPDGSALVDSVLVRP